MRSERFLLGFGIVDQWDDQRGLGLRFEGLWVKVVVCGVAVMCMIYCSSGVYAMFKGLFKGLSGVRMTGKTGKSGVSGELGMSWVGDSIFIYISTRV